MIQHWQKKYEGNALRQPIRDAQTNKILLDAYIPSEGLIKAVNLMILLRKRPLLLMGEPGCGKTMLAEAVAYELYGKNYQDHFFPWYIKSTTQAKDGLYSYDALRRLSDVQMYQHLSPEEQVKVNNLNIDEGKKYIQSQVLAKAFKASKIGKPSIILIDEIDKANLDFPNDLLRELEKFEFTIDETGKNVKTEEDFEMPLIFITSNQEKELPPAFLRRCIYYYINFPEKKQLEQILLAHFSDVAEEYREKAVQTFLTTRQHMLSDASIAEKKVSTSELIDWFSVIREFYLLKQKDERDEIEDKFVQELDAWLADTKESIVLPFHQLLLKNIESREMFQSKLFEEKGANL